MKGHCRPGENYWQMSFQWKFPRRISLQSGDGFGDVHECRSVRSENLDQRSFGVARWRLFLQVLEQLTVVGVEDLVSTEANQIKG